MVIPTYVINLQSRTDRKEHVLKEFHGKKEFAVQVVEARQHEIGAIGLWQTIRHIIEDLVPSNVEYFIICEDDHQFTEEYNACLLKNTIALAKKMDADIISGGVSWFQTGIQISKNLFWIEEFSATQFIIIFRKFCNKILDASFIQGDNADYKICELTTNKFVIYPFISSQKEFGYSDVTSINNGTDRVETLFAETALRLELMDGIRKFYLLDFKC